MNIISQFNNILEESFNKYLKKFFNMNKYLNKQSDFNNYYSFIKSLDNFQYTFMKEVIKKLL